MKKFREWFSVQLAKNPGRIVLFTIMVFNLTFLLLSSLIISRFGLSGTENMGLFEAAFYTITMILDAGCISYVVEDIGQSGTTIAIVCLIIVIIGMVSFTGAVIGYITNSISSFIENSNTGNNKIRMSSHIVILNWNTRASEIVNDLLFCRGKQKIIVLAEGRKAEIEKEISERLADTIARENAALKAKNAEESWLKRHILYRKNRLVNNVIYVVREGDVFSSKQLSDISLEQARAVIILGDDINNSMRKQELLNNPDEAAQGNAQTIKTLMQVSDITSDENSADDQKIIVEITDKWTAALVDKIIKYKQVSGKCNIVPVNINEILGQLLSQFSLMPELNLAYRELFSNKGATFFDMEEIIPDDSEYITKYLSNHSNAIPLSSVKFEGKNYFFYSAESEKDILKTSSAPESDYKVKLNRNYWIEKKNVIILGHNSKCREIMKGFSSFRDEWNYKSTDDEILRIIVVDDEKSLEKMNYYKEYPFVIKTVSASIYDKDIICSTIEEFVDENEEDTSVLILSDDNETSDNIDASALANLVYVQDIIADKKAANPDFDTESIDIIVEIIDPKHHDIVGSYSVDNIVISNRYISKMVTQIGEKEAIFNFYTDILTYDEEDAGGFESKEVYCKKVSQFFDELPGECTQLEFVRAVWSASINPSIPKDKQSPTIALGFVKPGGQVTLFEGDLASNRMKLDKNDKVIVYTNH
ncbi:MAG: hypothetical protein MJ108_08550 [Saccharofermentans sp.]|nr:hypothetical protein [Saccharofermentans sp.]